jgi:hypothetical protein
MTEVVWLLCLKSIGETDVTFLGAPKIIETSKAEPLIDGKGSTAAQPLAGFETLQWRSFSA